MHIMGLHGKSFMPLFLAWLQCARGHGDAHHRCSRAQLLTIILSPLVPCTGRLTVLAILVPASFPAHDAGLLGLTALPSWSWQ